MTCIPVLVAILVWFGAILVGFFGMFWYCMACIPVLVGIWYGLELFWYCLGLFGVVFG